MQPRTRSGTRTGNETGIRNRIGNGIRTRTTTIITLPSNTGGHWNFEPVYLAFIYDITGVVFSSDFHSEIFRYSFLKVLSFFIDFYVFSFSSLSDWVTITSKQWPDPGIIEYIWSLFVSPYLKSKLGVGGARAHLWPT